MDSQSKALSWTLGVVLVLALAVVSIYAYGQNKELKDKEAEISTLENQVETAAPAQTETVTAENCTGDSCLSVEGLEYPAGQLPAAVSTAVKSALDDEYKAYSVYDAVIAKIGSVRPFSMIIRAEESHIASLKSILDKYGETIPANPYPGKVTVEDTLKENCQIGVDAEIANVALYKDQLLPEVAAYSDITAVFNNLMNASNDKHLPSFEKCN
ncbi:MAG TPA: hypothetical protein PK263_02970 [bacterium]|nr:hypothetical protein [bacterium]